MVVNKKSHFYKTYIENQEKTPQEGLSEETIRQRADYRWEKRQKEYRKLQEKNDKELYELLKKYDKK